MSSSSMAYNSAAGLGGMLRAGSRHYTQSDDPSSGSVVLRNIDACIQISRMLLTSLGPHGRCKLVINHLGKVSVTSDCATILKNLDIEHPAAQLLVSAVTKQEEICGDNTNYVLAIGGELLYQTAKLIGKMSWQPANEILAGYQKALQLITTSSSQYISSQLVTNDPIDIRNREHLLKILKPVLASKQYGSETILAPLVADACLSVMKNNPNDNKSSFSVDAIRTVKILGAPTSQSSLLPGGYVALRNVDSVCQSITNGNCKIVVFACSIEASTTEAKGTVVMKNANDLLSYNHTEEQKMADIIDSIAAVGINVIVTGGNVSDVALHYIDRHNIVLLKMGSKFELRRLCQAIHATALVRLGPPTPEEIGYCYSVQQQEMGGKPVTIFQNDPNSNDSKQLATIILRASTSTVLADLERAVDDGVQAIAQAMKDTRIVYGGGAIEMAWSVLLQNEASITPGLSQYAIAAFGKALEIIPHTLAENSGSDPTQVLANMQSAHTAALLRRTTTTTTSSTEGSNVVQHQQPCNIGVDINVFNGITSMADHQTYDLLSTKLSALQLAVDAVITILKIDQIIMSKPAGMGPK